MTKAKRRSLRGSRKACGAMSQAVKRQVDGQTLKYVVSCTVIIIVIVVVALLKAVTRGDTTAIKAAILQVTGNGAERHSY